MQPTTGFPIPPPPSALGITAAISMTPGPNQAASAQVVTTQLTAITAAVNALQTQYANVVCT